MCADEFKNLMSKNSTSSRGGRRKLPYAFTEQGIYMLMTVQNFDYYADRVFEFALVSCDV
nr:ORF6N domain-containing protein [Gardnerella greenwoodii]